METIKKRSLKELKELVTENRVVKVEPIVRERAGYKKGHDGIHTFTGCFKDHGLPYNSKKRAYENPFLSEEEQEAFERLLDQKEGSLNLYNFDSPFWGKFTRGIPKEGITLDLNLPTDALMYRIFLVNPKFAKTKHEAGIFETQYLIVNEQEEKELESKLAKKKDEANDFMYDIKKSKINMINTLRLLGKKVDPSVDKEWLKTELYKVIDEVTVVKGVSGLDKFLAVMKDPKAELKLFILDAIDAEEIYREKIGEAVYYKLDGVDKVIGQTFGELVEFFSKEDPDTQQLVMITKDRMSKK